MGRTIVATISERAAALATARLTSCLKLHRSVLCSEAVCNQRLELPAGPAMRYLSELPADVQAFLLLPEDPWF